MHIALGGEQDPLPARVLPVERVLAGVRAAGAATASASLAQSRARARSRHTNTTTGTASAGVP